MIIRKKSKELLDKLRTPNYRQIPDVGMDRVSEKIIKFIINECKSTVLTSDDMRNLYSKRYESDIIKENLHQIVRQLILNGGTIPKEIQKIDDVLETLKSFDVIFPVLQSIIT